MHKCLIFLMLVCLAFESYAQNFNDTELSYYQDSIQTLASEWVIAGYGDGRFGPDNTITRAEILKILFWAKWVSPNPSDEACFPDVTTTKWYHPFICEWVKLWVVKGFEDGTFGPDSPVTVLEALAMWLRIFGIAPESGNPWYVPYRTFADTSGILDTASYSIATPMTRGKASELIIKIREYSTKKIPLSNISKGCTSPRNLSTGTHEVTVAGKTRSYILHVPSNYSLTNPAKLIIAIHGRTNSNSSVQGYMWLERQGDFIVAYPAWIPNGKAFSWSSDENITFIDTIIRDVSASHCIDRSHVHIVAHSLGAWFASRLACTRGDIFRSVAMVGGGGYTTSCNNTPTATLIFQREDDILSPASTARATETKMKLVNKCGNTTESVMIWGQNCQKWSDCSTGNPVIWCWEYPTYGNDPHSWPTGGGSMIVEWMRNL